MATYVNPAGNPPVTFNGSITFTKQQIADACRAAGPNLRPQPGSTYDPIQLLWALSGNESSFGANCRPRHENAYCTGVYSKAPQVVKATAAHSHAAHSSFGPWQMLLINATPNSDPESFGDLDFCAAQLVGFLNREILGRQGAVTLEQIADAYNSGNFHDKSVPTDYINQLLANYNIPILAPLVAAAS